MANEIHSSLSHLVLSSESVWGTTDAVPVWVHMPVFDYGVRFRPERRNAQPHVGLRQRKHGKPVKGMPSGPLQAALYGEVDTGTTESLAQYLLDWAFLNPENILTLPSKSAQWAEGPGVADKDHKGLRVNTATLSGSDQSGIIELALDLMGKSDANLSGGMESLPDDRNKLHEFEMIESTFTLAGSGVKVSQFQYQAANNLEVNYLGQSEPELITGGPRVDTLSMTLVKNSNTYDAYRRSTDMNEFTAELKLRGLHNGTGAAGDFTVATITFNRLQYADHEDERSFENLTKSPLQFDVLKPDDSNPAVSIAYSEE